MSSSSSSPAPTLSGLVLSTPHLLAYSIPLLLLSILLTFAGTFLTLDRSRSFAPSYTPVSLPGALDRPKKSLNFTWFLQGGIGGLAIGYVFGLQLSTFLTLLVPAVSASAPLSPNAFLVVWILCCILTTILGGRYKCCALLLSATSGGALLALALSVIFHPPLLSRLVLVILLSVTFPIIALGLCIPRFSRFLHRALRVATSSTGAFGLILSIALLAHIPAWADVWERLWQNGGDSWGSGKEKGLNAAFCIFVIVGIGTDWQLRRWFGECPDEKWDRYLANYTTALPNDASRAGTFIPLPSFWQRLFHSNDKKDTVFPASPKNARRSVSKDGLGLLSSSDDHYPRDPLKAIRAFPGFRKHSPSPKSKMKMVRHTRKHSKSGSGRPRPIKFGGDLSSDSSLSDSELSDVDKVRPWLMQKASVASSTPTLVDGRMPPSLNYDLELGHLKKGLVKADGGAAGELSDYSDYEGDLGLRREPPNRREDVGDSWSPGFMKRHSSLSAKASAGGKSSGNMEGPVPLGAVPATPSLIKALDRVSEAQRDAYGIPSARGFPGNSPHVTSDSVFLPSSPHHKVRVDGLPRVEEQATDNEDAIRDDPQQSKPQWDDFWKDVTEKARN